MRIVAGKFRSLPLTAPKGWDTRPTSDRLRETLFNVVAARVEGAIFADLFAGTGAVGMEALSRGASRVFFAENGKAALAALRTNLARLGAGGEARVESGGTLSLLRRLLREQIRPDIVFLDPPYADRKAYETTLQFLSEQPVLGEKGIVVAEHSRRVSLPGAMGKLVSYRCMEQGEAALTFFRPTGH